jgi:hypothetical protein
MIRGSLALWDKRLGGLTPARGLPSERAPEGAALDVRVDLVTKRSRGIRGD